MNPQGHSEPGPDSGIPEAYVRILRVCQAAGMSPSDAQDVAQDVFLWLLLHPDLPAPTELKWLGVVVQNFIRRHWQAKKVRVARESLAHAEAAVFAREDDGAATVNARLSLDRIEGRLPEVEARLLRTVRSGSSFAEAVKDQGIPRGSRTFFRKRLIAHMAGGLRAPVSVAREVRAMRGPSRATKRPPVGETGIATLAVLKPPAAA